MGTKEAQSHPHTTILRTKKDQREQKKKEEQAVLEDQETKIEEYQAKATGIIAFDQNVWQKKTFNKLTYLSQNLLKKSKGRKAAIKLRSLMRHAQGREFRFVS